VTVVFTSPSAVKRQERALLELARIGPAEEVLVLAPTLQAADELARMRPHASFGWYRMTLRRLAGVLAAPVLAARGLSPASRLSLEALCVRIVRHTARGRLGRFASLADRPGFPRALARTIEEVRMQNVRVPDPDLAALADAYVTELESTRLADSAMVLDIATNIAVSGTHALLGLPLIAYDVAIASARERAFISALSARAPSVLVTIPEGDETTTANAKISFEGATAETAAPSADHGSARAGLVLRHRIGRACGRFDHRAQRARREPRVRRDRAFDPSPRRAWRPLRSHGHPSPIAGALSGITRGGAATRRHPRDLRDRNGAAGSDGSRALVAPRVCGGGAIRAPLRGVSVPRRDSARGRRWSAASASSFGGSLVAP